MSAVQLHASGSMLLATESGSLSSSQAGSTQSEDFTLSIPKNVPPLSLTGAPAQIIPTAPPVGADREVTLLEFLQGTSANVQTASSSALSFSQPMVSPLDMERGTSGALDTSRSDSSGGSLTPQAVRVKDLVDKTTEVVHAKKSETPPFTPPAKKGVGHGAPFHHHSRDSVGSISLTDTPLGSPSHHVTPSIDFGSVNVLKTLTETE